MDTNDDRCICGLCEDTCPQSKIENHLCVKNFAKINIILNNYFYPVDMDGYLLRFDEEGNIERFQFNTMEEQNEENQLEENIATEKNINVPSVMDIELLINEISKRPILYNHHLSLQERTFAKKQKEWKEICVILKNKFTVQTTEKKWKSLRDSYSRILFNEKAPSGSGRRSSSPKWHFLDHMKFMNDVIQPRRTISNLEESDSPQPKKKAKRSNREDLLEKLVNAVVEDNESGKKQAESNNSNADIKGLFAMIEPILEKIKPEYRFHVHCKIMNDVLKAQFKYINND